MGAARRHIWRPTPACTVSFGICITPPRRKARHARNDGVWAPPGNYRVALTVNGQTSTQSLQVKADPRVKVSPAGLQREFELARKVEAARVRAESAQSEADKLLKALDAAQSKQAESSPLHTSIATLINKAADVSGVALHPDPRNSIPAPPRRTDSLHALSTDLAMLERAVDGADADPSQDAQTSYATLSKTLETTLGDWRQLKQRDLAEVNAKLEAAGAKPITL